jgi:two-component system sensor histidine kinase AgrC
MLNVAKGIASTRFTKTQIAIHTIFVIIAMTSGVIIRVLYSPLNIITTALIIFISLILVLKINILKSLFLILLTFTLLSIAEITSVYIILFIFKIDMQSLINSPFMCLLVIILETIFIYSLIKLFVFYFKKRKNDIITVSLKQTSKKQLKIFIIGIIIYIIPQMILFIINKFSYPIIFLIINSIQFILTSIFLLIYLKKDIEHEKIQSDLITSELHNKTMVGMVDGVRTLKHDYNNIMQSLNGYVSTKQYDKLQDHINKVLIECNVVNNLSIIDPKIFNEPAIYGIVGAKYFIAMKHDISFDFDIIANIKEIDFPMPELSRILGIFLDNAIEATQNLEKKYIRLEMKFNNRKCADIIRIINTYDTNVELDLNKIYDKDFSTKEVKSGVGLWEVKKIVNKNPNSQVYATIQNNKFIQNLIIEKLD